MYIYKMYVLCTYREIKIEKDRDGNVGIYITFNKIILHDLYHQQQGANLFN